MKDEGQSHSQAHGSLSWAEDVPAPSLERKSYFRWAIFDGSTRTHAIPAAIQNYIWKEHILRRISGIQQPRGMCEFGYIIKKQKDLICICSPNPRLNFCSSPASEFFRQQKTNSAINSILYGCQSLMNGAYKREQTGGLCSDSLQPWNITNYFLALL